MRRPIFAAAALLGPAALAAPVPAQEPAASANPAPARAPLAPFPEGYLDHDSLTAALRRLAERHPQAVRLTNLGPSVENRPISLITIAGADLDRPEALAQRPSLLIVANLEADHLVGSQVALGLAERLAQALAEKDEAVTALLKRVTVHIVPRLNPDGAQRMLVGGTRFDRRLSLQAIDRDRDGLAGEDGPDDLDGDGLALQMRVKDAVATLVADDKDPRILRKADPAKGERGVYSEYREGTDEDRDGRIDEDAPGGVNLARNWPHGWTEFDPEAGWSPGAEPETNGLIRWMVAHPEVAAVWTFGLQDNLASEPKKPGSTLDDADLPYVAELSRRLKAALDAAPKPSENGSAAAPAPAPAPAAPARPRPGADRPRVPTPPGAAAAVPGLDGTTDGSLAGWAYHQRGVLGLASRLWSSPDVPEPAEGQPKPPGDGEARWLYWNDQVLGGRGYVPFHPVPHPTLGAVEVGGWRPGVRLNPPAVQVESLVAGHYGFLKDLLDRFARLEVADVKVEPKGGDLFEVSASVVNPGYLPTALTEATKVRENRQVVVRLKLPAGAKLLTGRPQHQIDSLPGSGGRREFRWLILAPEGARSVDLDVQCPRAGSVQRAIPLR